MKVSLRDLLAKNLAKSAYTAPSRRSIRNTENISSCGEDHTEYRVVHTCGGGYIEEVRGCDSVSRIYNPRERRLRVVHGCGGSYVEKVPSYGCGCYGYGSRKC